MRSKWLLVFNLLVVYIFLQFTWWSVLIALQLREIYGDTTLYHKKLWMIFGEGFVFITVLIAGVYFVRRSFKREMAVNKQQKNFLLAVTHELKTPIAVSKLSLETIANRKLDEKKQKEIIQKAILETDRLNGLIENILLGVKIEEKNIELKKQKTNLSEMVLRQMEMFHHTIGRHHQVEIDIEENIVTEIDPHYFPSVLSNLFENAVKYSPEGSRIGIELHRKNQRIVMSVWDHGPGIPETDKAKIFDRFYRGGNEETRTAKGTGLGLFITKQLVEMHQGKIECRDNQPNGTVFSVTL